MERLPNTSWDQIEDAIERFAQMVDKPLIADTNVAGTLTFNDPQPYQYSEALDTLNLVLSMKDVMLTESGRYLRLVPFKKLPQLPLKVFRGLDKTGDTRPGEVVTVVLELKNLDAGEIAEAAASMLSSAGSIASLSRGRGLIVTDRLGNIQRVRQLLAEESPADQCVLRPVELPIGPVPLHAAGLHRLADRLRHSLP